MIFLQNRTSCSVGRDSVTFHGYGTYEISIGEPSEDISHDLLVTFSKPATVTIAVVTDHDGAFNDGPDEITFVELTPREAMTMSVSDDDDDY